MPPTMRPLTTTSPRRTSFTPRAELVAPRSGPAGLGHDDAARGRGLRPHQLELTPHPLADQPRVGLVLALYELDRAGHRLELGRVEHGLDLRAVQADLPHAALEDLQRRVCERAGPAVGLLLVLLHVGVE